MTVILCIDNNKGLMFNHRRQSRDSVIVGDICRETAGKSLWMNAYSAKLFVERGNVAISDCFLELAGEGDYCFVEGTPLHEIENRIQKIILYRWNRLYPADTWLDIPLEKHGWTMIASTEFAGSSHDKITREEYVR